MAIIQNAAKCYDCDTVILSRSVHDFVSCRCGNIFVDGGLEYIRHGWRNDNWISLVEYDDEDDETS